MADCGFRIAEEPTEAGDADFGCFKFASNVQVRINPQSAIRNQQSAISNQQSAIRNPQSAISLAPREAI
jgi:hypothetical protein